MRGKFHVRLNNGRRPIANKYREGKMQRTLKRELKVLEIVKGEAAGSSACSWSDQPGRGRRPRPASHLMVAADRRTPFPDGGTLARAGRHLRGRGQEPQGEVVRRGPRGLRLAIHQGERPPPSCRGFVGGASRLDMASPG